MPDFLTGHAAAGSLLSNTADNLSLGTFPDHLHEAYRPSVLSSPRASSTLQDASLYRVGGLPSGLGNRAINIGGLRGPQYGQLPPNLLSAQDLFQSLEDGSPGPRLAM